MFLSIMFTAIVLLTEAVIKILASFIFDETIWQLIVGSIFVAIGYVILQKLSNNLREFFKKG